DIYGILPDNREKAYDMMEIVLRLLDNSEFEEYKAGYGQSIICGLGRVDGWAVGIVANQRKVIKSKKGEMRSEEHTSELLSRENLHSFPTRRSSDLIFTEFCQIIGKKPMI